MEKTVYFVREQNRDADWFELHYTFDYDEAKDKLHYEADRGYRLNGANPDRTTYAICGYDIDTDDVDRDSLAEIKSNKPYISDAEALLTAWLLEDCFDPDPDYYEEYEWDYLVSFGTGAGDKCVFGTLDEAKEIADYGAAYTQVGYEIYDWKMKLVAYRNWRGVPFDPDLYEDGEEADVIQFGDFGYYDEWTEV